MQIFVFEIENAKSWKLLRDAGSKYVFKDEKLFEKFTKLSPEVQQYVAKFSDKDANMHFDKVFGRL